jgi:copper(I)-binding protein
MKRLVYVLIGVGLGLGLTIMAVSRDTGGDPGGSRGESAAAEADGLTITSPWVRPAELPADESVAVNTAAYLTISASRTDRLVGVECGSVRVAEVHETRSEADMVRMGPADPEALRVGPERPLELRPGGLHIMLMGLRNSLAVGDSVRLDLLFESGARVVVTAPVTDPAAQVNRGSK